MTALNRAIKTFKAPALALLCFGSSLAGADPYSYYGGDVDAKEKNRAIEACEYERLVEAQACNSSFNKTDCISKVHEECAKRHAVQRSGIVDDTEKEVNTQEQGDNTERSGLQNRID
ncbi:MAG: hypothetical protein AAF098_04405 [Pseudomonadota bacterium]